MPERLPIIYVRGYAGISRGIDEAVDDPFYGFNLGSTHVRVGSSGDPILYQFESPLLRLVTEMGYALLVEGGQEAFLDSAQPGEVPAASLWVHRFYDAAASTWQHRAREFRLEEAAEDLLRLVEKVLSKTGAPRVHLVAHSMGGLICRSLIQRVIPAHAANAELTSSRGGDATSPARAADLIDRLFTYGTPHGGIEFDLGFGLLEAVRDEFGIAGADIFGRERMYAYLTPHHQLQDAVPADWDSRINPDAENFPTERIFCLVGTNSADYPAARGLSSRVVGTKSDGLVQLDNAMVEGANHAFVHRSHSGRYGMVNSEEGYQNLIRFLFGDVKVTVDIANLRLPDRDELTWQAETRMAVRGLPVILHEQIAAHHCPILIEKSAASDDPADRPVPLVTTFLWSARARPHKPMRYTVHVRLLSLQETANIFFWRDHIEQSTDFDDILVIDVEQQQHGLVAWATWTSEITVPLREYAPTGAPLVYNKVGENSWTASVLFPASGHFLGENAAMTLSVQPV